MDLKTKGLREGLQEGSLLINLVDTGEMIADPLTKAVNLCQLEKFSSLIFQPKPEWSPVKGSVKVDAEVPQAVTLTHNCDRFKVPADVSRQWFQIPLKEGTLMASQRIQKKGQLKD